MKILLKELKLRNFKGIKEQDIQVNHVTNIYGENAAGKTTIFDSFCWLLFGKDSTDRKTFEAKTLDKNNKTNPKTECEVVGLFNVDGQDMTFRKTLVENWTKPKGQLVAVLKGNDTNCFVNDVPLKVGEYDKKVSEILPEGIFKLITNPLYFNSLAWQERRNVLMAIAGNITDQEVAASNIEFQLLVEKLSNKKLSEYKAELAAKKKKLKDSLADIPTRIDEVNRQKPEAVDAASIKREIIVLQNKIDGIDQAIEDANEAYNQQANAMNDKRNEINRLRGVNQNLEFEIKQQFTTDRNNRKVSIQNAEMELQGVKSAQQQYINAKTRTEARIATLEQQRTALRADWAKVNETIFSFDPSTQVCPTCKRELDQNDVESNREHLEANFNQDKQKQLSDIQNKGMGIANEITQLQNELSELLEGRDFTAELIELNNILDEFRSNDTEAIANEEAAIKSAIATKPAIFTNSKMIADLQSEIDNAAIKPVDNSELKAKRQQHVNDIDVVKMQLNNDVAIRKADERIAELEAQEKTQAQELADLEGQEFIIDQFTKAKIDLLESRINGKFKHVTFKMYNTTIEGNEIETCITLVKGVPFSDANNAAKINAGLDIINALCQHYNAYAPIFIDNRESVNNLIDCESQIVNLIVSTDKKLKIA